MRDFDYAVTPAKLLTPEMVQMIGKIHEFKGRQDILLNFYKEDNRLPEDIEKTKDPEYQSVYRLILSNYEDIMPTPREFLQIHRKLTRVQASAQPDRFEDPEEEEEATFDLHAVLKHPVQEQAARAEHPAQDQEDQTELTEQAEQADQVDQAERKPRDIQSLFYQNDDEDMETEEPEEEESDLPGFRKAGDLRPELAHMKSAWLQRSGLRFRETLQKARSNGIERVSSVEETDPEDAVERLCEEFLIAWAEDRIDKLVLIPMFYTDLISIRPFESDNEPFCRLVALLLLLKAGYKVGRYISLDSQIDKSHLTYSNVLQASTEGWDEERNNYSMFAAYFLSLVGQAYAEFEEKLKVPLEQKKKKPDRIRELIDARDTQITKKEIMAMFPDISKVTVERALTEMVKSGYIVKVGAGPSTAYIKSPK